MKSKSLLTASALVMMIASCTNDGIEDVKVQSNVARPSAGNVVLKLNPTGNDETRATWTGSGWTFNESTDRFAAMLMDEWKGGTGIDAYTNFVDYIQTNYPFMSEDGGYTWSSVAGAPLCEGNYFFTYPFDPSHTTRKTISFSVPATQNVYDENGVDAILPVKFYQHYLGYAFIPAVTDGGVNEVAPMFHPLFANPKFKFKNETGTDLKILKVLVRTHQEGKAGSPELMPTTTELRPGTAGFNRVYKKYANGELQDWSESTYAKIYKQEIAALFSHATTPKDGFFGSNEDEGVYEYVIDCGENYIVNNREYVRVSAVMPAGEYHNFDVYLFVEDNVGDRGIVRLNNTAEAYWNEADVETGSMQTVLKPGITQVYTAAFGNDAIENLGIKDFTVVNSEDLLFVAELKAKDGGRDLVTIKTLGDQVILNSDIYNVFAAENRKGIKWQIDGTIVIPENAAADAIDQLTTGTSNVITTIINRGNQTLTKDLKDVLVINYGTITGDVDIEGDVIVEGGKVDVDNITGRVEVKKGELIAIDIEGNVTNSGKLTANKITGDVDNKKGANLYVTTIDGSLYNYGYAEVSKITGPFTNYEGAEAIVGSTGTVNNHGKLTLTGSTTILGGNNYGTININGAYTVYRLQNNVVDGKKGIINVNSVVTVAKVIENYSGATINIAANGEVYASDKARVNNYPNAEINVEGKLAEAVYNSGVINVIKDGLVITEDWVEDKMGIIDVTQANAGTTSQAAKCESTENMYFRFVANKNNATDLEKELKARISAHNYGKNPVILVWDSTSPAEFKGIQLDEKANVTEIIIDRDLTLTGATRMKQTEYMTINSGKTLTIGNGVDSDGFNLGSPEVTVSGILKVNNHAVVAGDAKYVGTGSIYVANATFSWTEGANWTGKVYK